MPLNLSTFPLVAYPGRAPELAPRSGMGAWDPYALLAPADRLLPFVLSRVLVVGAAGWVSCARIEHADTGALVADLAPTGQGAAPVNHGLTLSRYVDPVAGVEQFAYYGTIIPGLILPCGVPLRLVVDNVWQSPRFLAVSDVNERCALLEWWHDTPLYGLPYGRGLRQRFYVDNGALHFALPVTKKEVTADASTGRERTDYVAMARAATVSVEAVPAYLAEALSATAAHAHLLVDGEPWQVDEAKNSVAGPDGGRDSFVLSLEQTDVLVRRNCAAALPVETAFTTALVRGWRCGDTSDTAPDYQPTGAFTCDVDENGNNGYANLVTRDLNPNSPSFGDTDTAPGVYDTARCPLPIVYRSALVDGTTTRNNCPGGQNGSSVYFSVPAGTFTSYLSQQDADEQAQDFYAANRQTYANANGFCLAPAPAYQPVYTPEGCFACQMVNTADPSDVRDATSAEAAQYFRTYDNSGLNCVECLTAF